MQTIISNFSLLNVLFAVVFIGLSLRLDPKRKRKKGVLKFMMKTVGGTFWIKCVKNVNLFHIVKSLFSTRLPYVVQSFVCHILRLEIKKKIKKQKNRDAKKMY